MKKIFIIIPIVFVVLVLLVFLLQPHIYLLKRVNADQVGVQVRGGKIVNVVPPGIYSDVGLFVDLFTYTTQAYQFNVTDPEVITLDNQRLGVTVSGSIFRPDGSNVEKVTELWPKYRNIYLSDENMQLVVTNLATQAMKVCVGDRPFQDSVIGSDRDSLRNCIDDELNKLCEPYGLSVENVTVPNVSLSPEVTALLDAITKSRLETEKAQQDKLKATAEGEAQQAQQEATIRVEQSKIQETTRQQIVLAALEEERLKAQLNVIEAEKANSLLSAQRDLEIYQAQAAAAIEKARADLAKELALAEIYTNNPNYYLLQIAMVNASAIKDTDKIIFTPEGVFPQWVFGDNILSTVAVPNPE